MRARQWAVRVLFGCTETAGCRSGWVDGCFADNLNGSPAAGERGGVCCWGRRRLLLLLGEEAAAAGVRMQRA